MDFPYLLNARRDRFTQVMKLSRKELCHIAKRTGVGTVLRIEEINSCGLPNVGCKCIPNDTRNVFFQLCKKVHVYVCLQHHKPEAKLRYCCTTANGRPPHSCSP